MNHFEIIKELISMMKKDQKMRKKWAESDFDMKCFDFDTNNHNKKRIKEIISDMKEWPKISEYGKEACEAAWVLVQHLEKDDLDFREKALKMMRDLSENEVDKKLIAKLEDRNMVMQGRPQIYGTSFEINFEKGTTRPHDFLGSLEELNKRRQRMGLDKIESHIKRAEQSLKNLKNN